MLTPGVLLSKESFGASFAFVIIITTKASLDNLLLDLNNFDYNIKRIKITYKMRNICNMRELIFDIWFYARLLFGRSNNCDYRYYLL